MAELFNDDILKQLKDALKEIENPMEIVTFVESGKPLCDETVSMMKQLSELNDKLSFTEYDLDKDTEKAKEFGIDKAPGTTFVLNGVGNGVKFYGLPGGHEINSLIFALIESSNNKTTLGEDIENAIKAIDKKVNIKVFVGLGCPHCPQAVMIAQKAAMINPNIEAEMIQADLYEDLSRKFGIRSVPHTFFNDKENILGAQPIPAFLEKLQNA
jgi:glutaredoxin-like protein